MNSIDKIIDLDNLYGIGKRSEEPKPESHLQDSLKKESQKEATSAKIPQNFSKLPEHFENLEIKNKVSAKIDHKNLEGEIKIKKEETKLDGKQNIEIIEKNTKLEQKKAFKQRLVPIKPQEAFIAAGQDSLIPPESLQYMNGFIRTQVGKMVEVEFLVGNDEMVEKIGTLVAVGENYIILSEEITNNIVVCDFESLKFMKVVFDGKRQKDLRYL